jgi:L-alanine-DL-glutamate epimerase-like enolase superfamily enzyme
MSHGNIINIRESLVGERLEGPEDVRRLRGKVLRQGLDIQQIHHAYSGADAALWDAVGKKTGRPVYRLLGAGRPQAKVPYASVLFGQTPEETLEIGWRLRAQEYRAAKFGWGPLGSRDAAFDEALVRAAREGIGDAAELMVDAGVAWGNDLETVLERAGRFAKYGLTWLEEPLAPDAIGQYRRLAEKGPPMPIAAGENCGTVRAAEDYVENSGVSFLQIDAGRIGGVTPARQICLAAVGRGMKYVNHTFKSRLSLAAALHVFADVEGCQYLEYPAGGSRLAHALVSDALERGEDGLVRLTERPGLGVSVNMDVVREFFVPVRIELGGGAVYESEGVI